VAGLALFDIRVYETTIVQGLRQFNPKQRFALTKPKNATTGPDASVNLASPGDITNINCTPPFYKPKRSGRLLG